MVGFHDVGVESRRNSQQGGLGAKERENISYPNCVVGEGGGEQFTAGFPISPQNLAKERRVFD